MSSLLPRRAAACACALGLGLLVWIVLVPVETVRRTLAEALPWLIGRVELPLPPFSGRYVNPVSAANDEAADENTTGRLIVQYSNPPRYSKFMPPSAGPRNLTCRMHDREVEVLLDHPSVVPGAELHVRIIHSPTHQSLRALKALPRGPRDVWVNHNREVPQMYPADLDPEYMAFFDLTMTHVRRRAAQSGVWWPYHSDLTAWMRSLRSPLTVPWRKRLHTNLVVAAASNCNDFAGRGAFLGALLRALPGQVLSAGRCHRTTSHRLSNDELRDSVRSGFFYLSLENAVCEDWVTEKLERALKNGVVPIVFDAPQSMAGGSDGTLVPDYCKVLPPGTYINAANFASIGALADHLKAVAANRTLYESYLWTHRSSGSAIRARWPEHRAFNNGRWGFRGQVKRECLLVERAFELRRWEPKLTPDTSCLPPLQLCHLLPRHECTPRGVAQRVRADVRPKPNEGRRAAAPVPGQREPLLRITKLGLEF